MDRMWGQIIGGFRGSLGPAWGAKLVDCSVEYYRQVRAALGPAALIVVRWVETLAEQERLVRLGAEGARQWYAVRRPAMMETAACGGAVAFEALNEIHDNYSVLYCAFECERLRLMHADGLAAVVGNFSVGEPDLGVWPAYAPMLRALQDGDLLGLHEYWVDTADLENPWHVGRWRLVPELAGVPIVVTECGRDAVEGRGAAGWQRTCDAATIVAELRRYEAIVAGSPQVVGAHAFKLGEGDREWDPFDLDAVWPAVVAEYSGRPPAWRREEEPVSETTIRVLRIATGKVEQWELETYLRRVLPAEMFASWPAEALKAGAVAARTYALHAIAGPRHANQGADVCDGPHCQAFGTVMTATTDQAVLETAGETWGDPCQYVARCGLARCPSCEGTNGTNGRQWPGRMCQYGAHELAEQGATYRQILAFYYDGAAWPVEPAPVETPYLPEFTEKDVRDPLGVVDKTCWWLEEEQRQREAGNAERAQAIRLSLIRWLATRREGLRAAG